MYVCNIPSPWLWPWRVRQKQDFLYATLLQQALRLAAPAPGNVTCVGDPLTYFHSICAPFASCSGWVDEWTVFVLVRRQGNDLGKVMGFTGVSGLYLYGGKARSSYGRWVMEGIGMIGDG